MEIFRFNIRPLAEVERREAFKESINNCPHCRKVLEFRVEIDLMSNRLKEDGHCKTCDTQVRSEVHSLQ